MTAGRHHPSAPPPGARDEVAQVRAKVILFFVGLSLAQLWPLPLHLASSVLGPAGGIQSTGGQLGDTLLNVSALGSVARLLVSQPAHLFDVNMYYPFRPALAA